MNPILSSFFLLFFAFLLPLASPLELKVQVVGWPHSHLLPLAPGKRFEVKLFKNRKGGAGPSEASPEGRKSLGHYDIGTFQLPEQWVNEMELDENGAFMRNNDYTLCVYKPSDGKSLKAVHFHLTARNHNLVLVTLTENGHMDEANAMPMDELRLPIRHLLFQIPSAITAKDASSNKSAILLLKRIECQSGHWSIGEKSLPLLAMNQRVCEDDVYLAHTAHLYMADLQGQVELPDADSPRQLFCDEAVHQEINVYDITVDPTGKLLVCRLSKTPLKRSFNAMRDGQMSAGMGTGSQPSQQQQQQQQLEAKRQKTTTFHQPPQQQPITVGGSGTNADSFNLKPNNSNAGTAMLSFNQNQHRQQKMKEPSIEPYPNFIQHHSQLQQQQQLLPQAQPNREQQLPPAGMQMPKQRQRPIEQWLSEAWQQFGPPIGGRPTPPHTVDEMDEFFGLWDRKKTQALKLALKEVEQQRQRNLLQQQPASSAIDRQQQHHQQQQQIAAGNIIDHQQQQSQAGQVTNNIPAAAANVISLSDDENSDDSVGQILKNLDFTGEDYFI